MRARAAGVVLVGAVALGISSERLPAQSNYEVLRSLIEPAYPPSGKLLEAANGRVYGVARFAGPAGKGALLAYDRQPDGSLTVDVIHAFYGPDGADPRAGVIEASDGALYGTTYYGGAHDGGTLYRVAPDGAFSVLHSFTAATGLNPESELVEASDGDLYGTTTGDHVFGLDTLFRITKTGSLTVLRRFGEDAEDPQDALIDGGDGKLYGITRSGVRLEDRVGQGTFFSITPDGDFTVLHLFQPPGPVQPNTILDGGDGFFYIATTNAGAPATVLKMSRTGSFTIIYTAPLLPQRIEEELTLLRGIDGDFYGISKGDGSLLTASGSLFRLTAGGARTTLHTFHINTGEAPISLLQTSDGVLMGGTELGGFNRRGVIFRATTSGQYSVAHVFPGSDPLLPLTPLVPGPDGALYGASCAGGAFNAGTVFKVMADGSDLTVLHSFAFWDGACPRGSLTFGHDGALYGTSSLFGLGYGGTIFRITTTGVFRVMYFFGFVGANGANPHGGLLRAADGNYYGTTSTQGTPEGSGTLFRLTPSGTLTTLHIFDWHGLATAQPKAPLIQATDGTIYGATSMRPFRFTLGGGVTLSDIVTLIYGNLTEGADGQIYGTSGFNGTGPFGTIFRVAPDGTVNVLHTFTGPDGGEPYAGMVLAPDGTFYGSTGSGGAAGRGTLFRFFGSGPPVTVHTFGGADGALPFAALTLGPDSSLYGTTLLGGDGDRGVIFRWRR